MCLNTFPQLTGLSILLVFSTYTKSDAEGIRPEGQRRILKEVQTIFSRLGRRGRNSRIWTSTARGKQE